jgi:hypothetical protein
MAGNSLSFSIVGDSGDAEHALDRVADAADNAADSVAEVGDAASTAANGTDALADGGQDAATGMAKVGATVAGATDALNAIGDAMQTVSDFASRSKTKQMEHARALADVEQASLDAAQAEGDLRQAQLDLTQSAIDGTQAENDIRQARIDEKQAALDAAVAQKEYNDAVKENGPNSEEARQASINLEQAQNDLRQAGIDGKQAENDLKQAREDGTQAQRDANQAVRDGKDAQLNLKEAQSAAHPSSMSQAIDEIQAYTSLAGDLVGTIGLLAMAQQAVNIATVKTTVSMVAQKIASGASAVVTGIQTAAQWLLNAAFWACPLTWIVAAIIAVIVVIVLIATKTTWFQTAWKYSWNAIKAVGLAIGGWFAGPFKNFFVNIYHWLINQWNSLIGFFKGLPGRVAGIFSGMWNGLKSGFRAAINWIIGKWNSLQFNIPSINVPFIGTIGGGSIGVPNIPYLAAGGTATSPGMAIVGERGPEALYMPRGATVAPLPDGYGDRSGNANRLELVGERAVVEFVRSLVKRYGRGDVVAAFGG